ncbi:helix-turn-helix domain-containing protein [Burkholderia anthina]|uniref:helix-turn-helix domain-containing protein n=1 Tax=Burkholderia anthina TaxID=179879 RepID=UPI00158D1A61|nr:helix-turn-helix transcriptional regulator [Burkholderia anthina]
MTENYSLDDLHRKLMEDRDARDAYVAQDRLVRLGQLLRRARKSRGLTQFDVHRRSGIDQADLSRIENGEGERGPTLETLIKYAQALDLDLCIAFADRSQHPAYVKLEETITRRDVQDGKDLLVLERF